MAIEWNKVDVALFNTLPRHDSNLSTVVEVKTKGRSCLTAESQARTYAEGKKNCHRLIVTDGLRYGIYIKQNSDFKASYPIYECRGVKEALRSMTPEWAGNLESTEIL